jgi:tetratricopeptide (TPR) repeat protein
VSYPGNPSLAAAVKDRVLSTFQQSVTLFKQGRMDEVAAGCTLLLQMDPMFDPAKKLLEKTRNPSAAIDVDALVPTSGDNRSRMQQAREAMAGRDYQRVVQLTSEVLTEDLLNDEARILGDEAQEKIEAAPFVEQFARKADASLAAGNVAAAKMELEKARSLDPGHPEVVRLAQAVAARGTGAQRAAAPSASFVVEDRGAQNAGGRSAQAADFGFTFEEEKTPPPATDVSFANFSFDTPTTADSPFGGFSFDAKPSEKPAAASEFDFATASVTATDDDQKKIDQYLADGDRAYASADYTAAIDLWSRIFLIDVTNDQASERIERAKGKRREIEMKVENLLASGIASFDRGETAKAHTELNEVLRLDPRNTTAQDYLDRLGETVSAGGTSAASRPYIPPSPSQPLDIFDDELPMGNEAPLIPPDPMTAPAATTKSGKQKVAPAPKPTTERKLPVMLIAIVAGVLVLGAVGYFAWSKFSGGGAEAVQSGEGDALMGRATTLAAKGKYDQAIALLRDIKPGDPQHDKALELIADLQQKKSSSAQLIDGVPAAQYYEQRVAAASIAFASGDYSAAKSAYEQALRVQPLSANAKAQYDIASQKASQLDGAKALFAERKYADAISSLQPLLDQDPTNASIRRMIADAHFNLGATALQEERLNDAIREMDEVLKMNPGDELAKRSRDLAVRYNGETKDLLYKIYVKYLPMRAG